MGIIMPIYFIHAMPIRIKSPYWERRQHKNNIKVKPRKPFKTKKNIFIQWKCDMHKQSVGSNKCHSFERHKDQCGLAFYW